MDAIADGETTPATEPIFADVMLTFCAVWDPLFGTTTVAITLLLASRERVHTLRRLTAVVGLLGITCRVSVCGAGEPTPFWIVIWTLWVPTSAVAGVPEIVRVPVLSPTLSKLLACRLEGSPETVKYGPVPSEALAGGPELAQPDASR